MAKPNGPAALVYVRVHASIDSGLGHLFRCLALADELRRRRLPVKFVFSGDEAAAKKHLGGHDCAIVAPGFATPAAELPWLIELVAGDRAAASGPTAMTLLVDHYGIDARWESAVADHVDRLVVIDDLADRSHLCDVLVDATYGRRASNYVPLNRRAQCDYLLGPEYALLRDQFRAARTAALDRRRGAPQRLRVLICLGGYDPQDRLSDIVSSVLNDERTAAHEYTVIIDRMSPNFRRLASIRAANLSLLCDVSNMAERMLGADVAIGAGGTMTWERAVVGLPAIVVEVAANQKQIISTLSAQGAIVAVAGADWLDRLRQALMRLHSDQDFYRRVSDAAFNLTAGLGSKLVAMRLASADMPTLRPATADDVHLLFAWQSEPGARKYSRNPDPPVWQEHLAWFERVRDDPRRLLMMIAVDGAAVGMLRLDYLGDRRWEISVLVATAWRNRSHAYLALKQADTLYPECSYYAAIRPDNRASVALFEKAGYRRCSQPAPITGCAWVRPAAPGTLD